MATVQVISGGAAQGLVRALAPQLSMQGIMAYLRSLPDGGRALMEENKSFVFFKERVGPGPLGAMSVPVTPRVTVAADPANVPLGDYVTPRFGVYATRTRLPDGREIPGVANIGVNPTVDGVTIPLLEVWLFDFDEDIYDQVIETDLVAFLRPEEKFENLDVMTAQVMRDAQTARDLLAPDGTFKSKAEIRAAFEAAEIDLARPITTTCGSGVTASVLLFALHLIGIDEAALYDGSWSEWGADPATPKETGSGAKSAAPPLTRSP